MSREPRASSSPGPTNIDAFSSDGVGKTMLAVALGRAAVEAGYRTHCTTAACCHRAAIEGRWAATMRFYAGPRLLIIDEVGCAPRGAISPGGQRGPPPATAMAGRSWGQSDS